MIEVTFLHTQTHGEMQTKAKQLIIFCVHNKVDLHREANCLHYTLHSIRKALVGNVHVVLNHYPRLPVCIPGMASGYSGLRDPTLLTHTHHLTSILTLSQQPISLNLHSEPRSSTEPCHLSPWSPHNTHSAGQYPGPRRVLLLRSPGEPSLQNWGSEREGLMLFMFFRITSKVDWIKPVCMTAVSFWGYPDTFQISSLLSRLLTGTPQRPREFWDIWESRYVGLWEDRKQTHVCVSCCC